MERKVPGKKYGSGSAIAAKEKGMGRMAQGTGHSAQGKNRVQAPLGEVFRLRRK